MKTVPINQHQAIKAKVRFSRFSPSDMVNFRFSAHLAVRARQSLFKHGLFIRFVVCFVI